MGQASKDQAWEAIQAVKKMLADPDFEPGDYTDEDWRLATERVRAIRERVLTDPKIAELENRKYAEISRQVQTLKAIRQALGLTQQQMSARLDITQAEVSRIEHQGNLYLTTLCRYIEAAGGKIRITASFDDYEVEVGIGDLLASGSV